VPTCRRRRRDVETIAHKILHTHLIHHPIVVVASRAATLQTIQNPHASHPRSTASHFAVVARHATARIARTHAPLAPPDKSEYPASDQSMQYTAAIVRAFESTRSRDATRNADA